MTFGPTAHLGVSETDAGGLTEKQQEELLAHCRQHVELATSKTQNENENSQT
jgi:hypothetical protein